MAHVTRDELHPLFYSLERHHTGEASIAGLQFDEEFTTILNRVTRDDARERKAPLRLLTEDRVRAAMKHTAGCNQCQMLVYEEGPYAKRPQTEEELAQERGLLDEEERKLAWRFGLCTASGFAAFIGANFALRYAKEIGRTPIIGEGPAIGGQHQFQLNPLHALFMVLLVIAAFSLAESWRTANLLWLDWSRAKEAVPLIGKRWAARGRRKKAEAIKREQGKE